jgi:hypothetical protein
MKTVHKLSFAPDGSSLLGGNKSDNGLNHPRATKQK